MIRLLLYCLCILPSISLLSQEVNQQDSISHRRISMHGISLLFSKPIDTISKYSFQRLNYIGAGDILYSNYASISIQSGDPGIYSTLSILGSTPNAIQVSMQGNAINDPLYGSYNLSSIAPEVLNNASLYTGLEAAVLGGSTGIWLYIQEPKLSANKPYTKLWYSQSGYDYLATDGTFSQNISKDINATVGYRRQVSGGYYNDSGFDIWNLRAQVRYEMDSLTTISFSEHFTNQGNYQNGGVNPDFSFIDPLTTNTLIQGFSTRTFRHNAQVLYSSIDDNDSNSVFHAGIFLNNVVWEQRKSTDYYSTDSVNISDNNSIKTGFTLRYDKHDMLNNVNIIAGLGTSYTRANASSLNDSVNNVEAHFYAIAQYNINNYSNLKLGTRIDYQQLMPLTNYGISFTHSFSNTIDLIFDASQSFKRASFIENWQSTSALENERHTTLYSIINYRSENLFLSIKPFYRVVNNAIKTTALYDTTRKYLLGSFFYNTKQELHYGLQTTLKFRLFDVFDVKSFLSYQHSSSDSTELFHVPNVYAAFNAEYTHFINRSAVSAGLTLRIASQTSGLRYIPQNQSFAYEEQLSQNQSWNGLDVYASAILGNARVRLSLMNAFSATMMDLAGYPLQDNTIRLSVSWSFND